MPLWCNVSVRRKRCSLVWIFYCVCCFKKIHTRDMTSVIHTYFILAWEAVFYWALETGRSQSWNSSFRVERFELSHAAYFFFYGKVKLGKHKELFPLFYFCPLTLTSLRQIMHHTTGKKSRLIKGKSVVNMIAVWSTCRTTAKKSLSN